MRAAIDFAASSAGADICLRLPRLQHVTVALAVADRFAEVQRGPRRPGGPHRDQGDLVVDLDDRLGQHPVVREPGPRPPRAARPPRRRRRAAAPTDPRRASPRPASPPAGSRRVRRPRSARRPTRRTRTARSAGPSSSAASLRRPSRSCASRTPRGVGNTSRPRSAAATSASTAMTPDSATTYSGLARSMIAVSASASFILTTAARSATPCAGASAYRSTATTSRPSRWNASASSRLSSPEPSSITGCVRRVLGGLGGSVGLVMRRVEDLKRVLGIGGLSGFTHRESSLPDRQPNRTSM